MGMFTDLVENKKQSEDERFELNKGFAEKRGLSMSDMFSEGGRWFGNYVFNVCGHPTTREISNIRNTKGVLVCKICSDTRASEAEALKGVVCIGASSDGSNVKRRYVVDSCGHEVDIFYSNLQKPPLLPYECKECLVIHRQTKLNQLGLRLVSTTTSTTNSSLDRGHLYRDFQYTKCGHIFSAMFTQLSVKYTECIECKKISRDNLNSEAGTTDNTRLTSKFKVRDMPISQRKIDEAIEKGLTLVSASDNRCYGYYKLSCGHNSFLHYGAIRKARTKLFKCTECLDVKLAQKAEEVGVVYNRDADMSGFTCNKRSYTFPCGHVAILQTGNVESKQISCVQCREDRFIKEAQDVGIVLIDSSLNGDDLRRLYKLNCGHMKKLNVGSVRGNSFRCRICQEDQYQSEAASAGIALHPPYKGETSESRAYTLQCGCSKKLSTACVRKLAFECKTHPDRKFDFSRPISVYLIKLILQDIEVLKLGYSTEPTRRFRCYGLDGSVEIIKVTEFSNGQTAVDLERHLHEKYKSTSLNSEQMSNYMENGFTECYPLEMKDVLLKELKI